MIFRVRLEAVAPGGDVVEEAVADSEFGFGFAYQDAYAEIEGKLWGEQHERKPQRLVPEGER